MGGLSEQLPGKKQQRLLVFAHTGQWFANVYLDQKELCHASESCPIGGSFCQFPWVCGIGILTWVCPCHQDTLSQAFIFLHTHSALGSPQDHIFKKRTGAGRRHGSAIKSTVLLFQGT